MFRKILVPLDGSALSELALPYAEELAGALNSEVKLVYVCVPTESEYRHMHQLYIEKMAQQVRSHIKAYPTKEANPATSVKAVILDGEPAAEIISYAEENDISLTIMVSHGRSGIMPWAMGSIANKVIHTTSKPILLIRARTPLSKDREEGLFNKILIPLDGSEAGEAALPYIKELAKKLKTEVTLFQVVEPGQFAHTVGGLNYIPFPESEIENLKARAKQYLEKAGGKLTGTKATIRSEVKTGHIAQEIIKLADETNTRLVAMSTHGRSAIRQWVFGSITHKVLHSGNTPVLLVRAPEVNR